MKSTASRLAPKLNNYAVALILIALCVFLALRTPQFATAGNIANVLEQISMIGVLAIGTTLLLVSGNFDLSIGGMVGLTGVVGAHVINTAGLGPGIIAMILLGVILGALNGLLVVRLRINSLIATLGSGLAFAGAAMLVSSNAPVPLQSMDLLTIVNTRVLGVSVPVIVFLAVAVLGHLFLRFTVGGRQLYAVGANEQAARLAGIRVGLIKFVPFVLNGLLSAISGLLLLGLLGSGIPDAASSWALQIVAAVVVGGVSVAGGRGTVPMAVVGVLLIGVINNGLNLLNFDASWQSIATGTVLVIAVALDSALRSRVKKARPAAAGGEPPNTQADSPAVAVRDQASSTTTLERTQQ